jgi:hypothetical protein
MADYIGELAWKFGLKSHRGNFLSAETFGFRLNCSGKSLKKKQVFTLEQDESGFSFIRT